jgi:DNA-directed RNA polymerase subunit RPC12/RpoP
MSWITAWFCVNCDAEVSWETKMGSHGRCPHCGFKGDGAVSIMKTREEAREVEDVPWWRFWASGW